MLTMVHMLLSAICASFHVERRVWIKQRSSHFWQYIVKRTFSASDWHENFRMSKETFDYLCEKLRLQIEKKDTPRRPAIPVEQRLAICLWCLASSVEYRTVAHLFGVSKASVCLILRDVSKAIVKVLMHQYVQLPKNEDQLCEIVTGFRRCWGFPCCGGAIDGSHIPVSVPSEVRIDYYNRKGWYSILLQAVVDHKYCFTDIYIGWPGSVHDARVFANSELYQNGRNGTLFPQSNLQLDGNDVPVVILGDAAYPLMSWLLKPFPHGALNRQQQRFNYRLSRARMVTENAFGRLKGRWRCLLKKLEVYINNAPVVVAACCILHNICEIHGDEFDHRWLEEAQAAELSQPDNNHVEDHDDANHTRDLFVAYMNTHPL